MTFLSGPMCFLMISPLSVACWNVRGLNSRARRAAVRAMLDQLSCSIICLQESKLATAAGSDITEIAGPTFDQHAVLPADGTRGGVLLCWRTDRLCASAIVVRRFSITATFSPLGLLGQTAAWTLTTVYGPHDYERKQAFLNEIADIHNSMAGPWLIIGDFNLITDPCDKNNDRICRRWMNKFRRTLNSSSLRELPLIGRRFTWSNEQDSPTLVRLDRAFCNVAWELMFPAAKLLLQASSISDHCPLLLRSEVIIKTNRRFRFEAYWQNIQGFHEVV